MNTILNHLKFRATNLWARYRQLPPAIQIAGGIIAVVVLAKTCWPAAFIAIIATTVVLLQQEPEGD